MKLRFPHCPAFLLLGAVLSATAPAATPEPLRAFLDQHCFHCHDADEKKGDLDLTGRRRTGQVAEIDF